MYVIIKVQEKNTVFNTLFFQCFCRHIAQRQTSFKNLKLCCQLSLYVARSYIRYRFWMIIIMISRIEVFHTLFKAADYLTM